MPSADYVAKGMKSPLCRKCNVPVEFTGLSIMFIAILVNVMLGLIDSQTKSIPSVGVAIAFAAFTLLAAIRWIRQYKAYKRNKNKMRTIA